MTPNTHSESPGKVQGTIINASFPRSGHRFLRVILSNYFGRGFILYKHHTKQMGDKPARPEQLRLVNVVKTHDFNLAGRKVLSELFPDNRKYLVQIRHPLESIASYYEFALTFGELPTDNETTWQNFLSENLKYWKRFYKLWVLNPGHDSLIVTYDNLFNDTHETARKAVSFLSDKAPVDQERLARAIEEQVFLRYDGDPESKQHERRKISSFRYFNEKKFKKIEKSLISDYLQPQGIKLLFH